MATLKENTLSTMPAPEIQFDPTITGLSARHMQVLDLLVNGLSNELMASQLNITTGTLRVHLQNIFRIMQVKSRGEAVAKIVGFDSAAPGTIGSLCAQEIRVLELLASGAGAQSISDYLHISAHTVRTYLSGIYLALGVDGHDGAVAKFELYKQTALDVPQLRTPARRSINKLTDQDKEILRLLSDGLSRGEIAELIGVTKGVLGNYICRIYKALGVENEEDALDVGLHQRNPTYDSFAKLRNRERDVLSLLMDGETTSNIARILSIKPGTVVVYYSNIRRSLQAKTLEEAIEAYRKVS
jgi:DNA-binding NarL/FixJ family response regulator